MRVCLLRLEPRRHLLMVNQHHIISDGWSMEIFFREWAQVYGALLEANEAGLAPLALQYADYAHWQQHQGSARIAAQLSWWQEQLADMPAGLDLPLDKARPQILGYQGRSVHFELNGDSTALIQAQQVTPFMLHLAALAALLARYAGQSEVTLGTPIANRTPAVVADLIGFFANTLALPVRLRPHCSFNDVLGEVRAIALDAFNRADTPFEKIVEALQPDRSLGRSPLFQVLFSCAEARAADALHFPGLTLEQGPDMHELAKFELHFTVIHTPGSNQAMADLVYNCDLWEHRSIVALTRTYQGFFSNLLTQPDAPVMRLSLLDESERQRLVAQWSGQFPVYPREANIVALFERQVEATPQAIALVSETASYDYASCNRLANQYAAKMAELGLRSGQVAALCLPRGPEAVIVILAILKRGACYLPLDANFPLERITTLCRDSRAHFLLTRSGQLDAAPIEATHFLDHWDVSARPAHNQEHEIHPLQAAYVIYTSGSTGVPKGVVVPHRAVVRLVRGTGSPMFASNHTYIMTCSLAFDVSTFEIWGALLSGARLVPLPEGQIEHLGSFLVRQRITVMWLTAQLFNVAVDRDLEAMAGLRYVLAGGEALSPPHVRRFLERFPEINLINGYGPTENTTFTTCGNVSELGIEPGGVPLGPPIPNTSVYITDRQLQLVPAPIFGELVSGGDGVASGYLARPALTAEKFVPNPFSTEPGSRLYRTGDLARWLLKDTNQGSGVLEYAGRIDRQVKLRGFRIELGEIEAVLNAQAEIRQALVLARDTSSGKQLVAYVAAAPDLDVEAVLARMRKRLPAYMLPAGLTVLDAFPVNNSGKIDQKRLPAPHLTAQVVERTEKLTPTGEVLAQVWRELLGVEELVSSSDFFQMGGHSLLALRLISAINRQFQREISMKAVFEFPRLADLARHIDACAASIPTQGILRHARPTTEAQQAPLSFMQQRLWFIDRLEGPSPTYNIPQAAWIEGALNVAALKLSLNQLVARHETLRTRFVPAAGEPQQLILPQLTLPLTLVDLSQLRTQSAQALAEVLAERERLHSFDLEHGPLTRALLVRIEGQRHLLLVNQHHIISDGWSMEIFIAEWAEAYGAILQERPHRLAPLSLQYADYARWQQGQDGARLAQQLAWWQEQLSDMPAGLDLPLDKTRPQALGYGGHELKFELVADCAALLRDQQVTPFMLHLAALAALLARSAAQNAVTLGTPIANRTPAGVEQLIGFFANTLALPVHIERGQSFVDLLRQVRATALEAFAHADAPFEKIVELVQPDRNLGRSPLFQVLFVCAEKQAKLGPQFPGLSFQHLPAPQTLAKFELNVDIAYAPDGERAEVTLVYNSDLWEQASMEALSRSYQRLFQNLVKNSESPLMSLSLQDDSERQVLLEQWSGTRPAYPRDAQIVALFEAQAAAHPDAIALVDGEQSTTYANLNRLANQYAAQLAELGLQPGLVAALCLPRGLEAILVILAILKRGACYLPLDANFPLERIATLCSDSAAHCLLTRKEQLEGTAISATHYLDDWELSRKPDHNPGLEIHPLQAAYVIYTSGSTGVPKGVVVPHRAVLRLVCGTGSPMFEHDQTFLMASSLAFDASTFEIWGALLSGARLALLPEAEIEHLGAFLTEQRISVMWLTAQLFNVAVDRDLESMAGLRYVLTGGEALSQPHVRRFLERFPEINLINGYGPTENTTFTTCGNLSKLDLEPGGVPLGPPIANTSVYITDAELNLVPVSLLGELVSGGDGLARGYLAQPGLTAEKFVPNPFAKSAGERLYRTGDLARWLLKYRGQDSGVLEYAGRIDRQVKLRGFRIELGEIEAVLNAQPGIRQALVLARDTSSGKQLVAYVVAAPDLDCSAVLAQMRLRLPAYMIPASLTVLEAFPVNNSGKIDQKRLPAPSYLSLEHDRDEPLSPTAVRLAQLWRTLLGVEELSGSSDFFSLGGHSLLVLRLVSAIKQSFGRELSMKAVFEANRLADLAQRIDSAPLLTRQAAIPRHVVGSAESVRAPLSYMQQRLFFIDKLEGPSPTYNIPLVASISGALSVTALQSSLNYMIERHASLRTRIAPNASYAEQLVQPELRLRLLFVDLSPLGAALAEVEALRLSERERQRPFDLERGPLVRVQLLRTAGERHVLVINQHHIISDGWSIEIFVREWSEAYGAALQQRQPRLAPLALQYTDYARWQQHQEKGRLEAQLDWWQARLGDMPPALELPVDKQRPQQLGFAGHTLSFALEADCTPLLRSLQVTPFMLHLAVAATLLARSAAQSAITLGTPIANRTPAEVEPLIGFFANTLALPILLPPQLSFIDLLRQVRETALDAFAHADTPFEKIVERLQPDRSLGRSPLFQVLFTCDEVSTKASPHFPGLSFQELDAGETQAKFELNLAVRQSSDGSGAQVFLVYNRELWERPSMEALTRHYQRLYQNLMAEPDFPLLRVSMLDPDERRQLLDRWSGQTREFPRNSNLIALFESQAAARPGAAALVSDTQSYDYASCNSLANQYAARLTLLGLRPGQVVALCLARDPELVIAILAILKCGACYLPLDANFPLERIQALCADSAARLLLTRRNLLPQAAIGETHYLEDWDQSEMVGQAPSYDLDPLQAAYIMYTSGSTGAPKGVVVPHRAIIRLVCGTGLPYFNEGETYLLLSSPAFDASTFEIWGALLNGARLACKAAPEIERLGGFLERHQVSVVWLTAQLFNVTVDQDLEALAGLRFLLSGGEALSPRHVARFLEHFPEIGLINGYGPTENTTFTTTADLARLGLEPAGAPLGAPIPNSSVFIVNPELELVPANCFGELLTGGSGLAQGYLQRPALTAEKFIPNPFADTPGERLYRTGDLARWLQKYGDQAQGVLEYGGRMDRQLKLRGFRIELGEIEAALVAEPGIRQALVLARETAAGKQLLAYATATAELDVDQVLANLARRLPAYMLPAGLTLLEHFPVNHSGKLDQKRLPKPQLAQSDHRDEQPLSPTASALALIWSELLGVDVLSGSSDFFQLGGHSLLVLRLVSATKRSFKRDISMKTVFEHPRLAQLARQIDASNAESASMGLWRQQPEAGGLRAPLSFMQQRLWFIDRLEGASPTYNIPMTAWAQGPLSVQAMQQSLNQVIERHESLRTRFVPTAEYPEQLILPKLNLHLVLVDFSQLERESSQAQVELLAERERVRPFDLEQGPLIRVHLLRIEPARHLLMVNQHHIISDGWSMEIFTREWAEGYGAAVQGRGLLRAELPLQYADYARWQQHQGSARLGEQLKWWREQLGDMPAGLDLPLDKARPQILGYQGETLEFELLADSSALMMSLQVTPFMIHLAALAALLARSAAQDGVTIGTPIANRTPPEVEQLIGFFANTLALPVRLNRQLSFADLLRQVRETALDAFARADSPFEKIVETLQPDRSLGRSPLFQVLFTCDEARSQTGPEFPGLRFSELEAQQTYAKFELNVAITHRPGAARATVGLVYNTELWERRSMESLGRSYQRLFQNMVAQPQLPLMSISMLDPAERRQLLEHWSGQSPDYPRDSNIVALFEQQVAATPNAIALVGEAVSYDYASCNRLANQYAAKLAELGLQPGDVAALCLPRGIEAVLVILAILKRGACYLPMDASFPVARIITLCNDSHARLLFTRRSQLPEPPTGSTQYLEDWDLSGQPDHNPGLALHALQAAYVIYTSGSTGVPKGVVVPHRAVLRLVRGTGSSMFGSDHIYIMTCSMAFDVSTFEIWGALLSGARLVPMPEGMIENLGAFLVAQGITVMWLTAQLFNVAVERDLESMAGLRYVLVGGEALSPPHVRRFLERFPQIALHNGYGPTENTTFTTCGNVSELGIEPGGVPLGPPIPNTSVYITDQSLNLVPTALFGELVSGGDGVASGYLQRPALTAEKFVPNPFATTPGERLYRTGDLARWLPKYTGQPSGVLEYAGRIDRQIKLRGFRIELGEIEAALNAQPEIRQALVLARDTASGKQLVAYVTAVGELDTEAVLAKLRKRLPAYMLPAGLTVLEHFPVNNSGKIDQRRLPAPSLAVEEAIADVPLSPTAFRLGEIWRKLLGVDQLGSSSNFFALGGHSLLALKLTDRIAKTFGVALPLASFFAYPSLGDMAEQIDQNASGTTAPSTVISLGSKGKHPALFLVHPIGGQVFHYHLLAQHLDRPVYGFQAAGLLGEPPQDSVHAQACRYIEDMRKCQAKGPYLLGAWSYGGLVAHEMAHQLQAQGEQVNALVLIDSHLSLIGQKPELAQLYCAAANDLARAHEAELSLDPDALAGLSPQATETYVIEQVRAASFLGDQGMDQLKLFLMIYRANAEAAAQHSPKAIAVNTLLLQPQGNAPFYQEAAQLWQAQLTAKLTVKNMKGDHFSCFHPTNVENLARQIEDYLYGSSGSRLGVESL